MEMKARRSAVTPAKVTPIPPYCLRITQHRETPKPEIAL